MSNCGYSVKDLKELKRLFSQRKNKRRNKRKTNVATDGQVKIPPSTLGSYTETPINSGSNFTNLLLLKQLNSLNDKPRFENNDKPRLENNSPQIEELQNNFKLITNEGQRVFNSIDKRLVGLESPKEKFVSLKNVGISPDELPSNYNEYPSNDDFVYNNPLNEPSALQQGQKERQEQVRNTLKEEYKRLGGSDTIILSTNTKSKIEGAIRALQKKNRQAKLPINFSSG